MVHTATRRALPVLLAASLVVTLAIVSAAPAPAQGTPAASADTAAIEHALSRLTYGARPGDVERVRQIGLSRWIDDQLQPARIPDAAVDERLAAYKTLAQSSQEIAAEYIQPAQQARRTRQQQAPPEMGRMDAPAAGAPSMTPPAPGAGAPTGERAVIDELQSAKLLRAVYSERQLEEVLVDFWFNHFNVFAGKGRVPTFITAYERDAIRPHVLGSFRELLEATAKSPAMLFYLDNWQSAAPEGTPVAAAGRGALPTRPLRRPGAAQPQRPGGIQPQRPGVVQPRRPGAVQPQRPAARRPGSAQAQPRANPAPPPAAPNRRARGLNENYGRELMELHTLGVDAGYTQKDVTEVARAFTGWTIDPRTQGFRFAAAQHDAGAKVVLGQTIKAGGGIEDGERVLDLLAAHPATAKHIAWKLVQRFVSDTPPPALVDRAAARFTATKGDLREVVRTIVTSPEFFAAGARHAKIKTPLEFVASALRRTGAEITQPRPLLRALQQMGMPLYMCQPPTGYGDTADAWVSSGGLVARINFANELASGRLRGARLPAAGRGQQRVAPKSSGDGGPLALMLGAPEFQRR